ncbi:hypothetical protein ACFLZU_05770 [Thermodesulfobacteriota bacterium]
MNRLFVLFSSLLILSGCASFSNKVADGVKPIVATQELDSSELLDVAIVVFDSEELTDKEIRELGLSEEIRRAEERFIPIHLKYTMQRTGHWGAVRVVPAENAAHVQVRGTIIRSDGEQLSLDIEAYDSRGVSWFENSYSEELGLVDFHGTSPGEKDPFQDLYNTIANDLVEHRSQLTPDEIREIQQISELRTAQDMARDAFAGHLSRNEEGRYSVIRLPVESDPMLKRVRAVQVRDDMLLDTINGYYEIYYNDLWQPYGDWRKLYNEELAALYEVKKQALTRQLFGLASIIGGVALSTGNNSLSSSNLPGVMVMGGAAAIYSGFQKQEETKIHRDVIEELSLSFSSEAEPLVVEVVGETVRLTGSAEEQYQKWRAMLQQIYASETGLPLEPTGDDLGQSGGSGSEPGKLDQ